uniref:Uncharacterized protein n=1 Tax=Anguilla anguilla TaxID=7936 RepID=A0A0E9UFQ1_ANGAN
MFVCLQLRCCFHVWSHFMLYIINV